MDAKQLAEEMITVTPATGGGWWLRVAGRIVATSPASEKSAADCACNNVRRAVVEFLGSHQVAEVK